MAGEEVYVARLGAWIARALGESGDFGLDLDTDAFGFQMPDAVVEDQAVKDAGITFADAGSALSAGGDALDAAILTADQGDLVSAFLQLFEGLYLFIDATAGLVAQIEAKAATLPAAERNATEAFGLILTKKTVDFLVISLLEEQFPRLLFLFKLLGLVDWRVIEESGEVGATRHVRKDLHLERIKDLIQNPAEHLAQVHKWGTAQFDPSDIFSSALNFYPEYSAVESGVDSGDAYFESGAFRWGRDSSLNPPGLKLDISADISHDFTERVELSDEWGTDFNFSFGLAGGAIFRLAPPFDFSVEPKEGTAQGALLFKTNRNEEAQGFTIVGGNDFIQLTAQDVAIGAGLEIGASTTGAVSIDPGVFAELKGLTLSLGSENADNFLASMLAEANIEGVFDLGLGWKLSEGLVVKAAGGLEIAIPMHQSLGIATLDTLFLVLKIRDDGSFALEVSVGITGQLGPLSAVVERMGVELVLSFSDDASASTGPVQVDLRFKPPSGVGLAIDAGVVRGGGYLYLDYDKGEYAGALELVFSGFLAVKAIGLITTKMPDGSDGFSLLIVVTAEFGTPIQLGFGFTLIGLGGLLGLNRTMRLEELAEGVRTGAVESVMFPQNVIANAPRIISDMRRFFPPQEGRFLIGPMAKLGWGTPSLVTASLGLIIEVPPGNIAILGVLKCVLPDEDAALLVLQVKFIGALEVDKQRLWFFASLFGSRVLFITLGGEMGLLIAWGDDANFVLSVGGFHPKFTPPPMPFPSPQRISLSILNESWARIRVEAYFAVTSNTAQFGAAVEIYIGVEVFSIEGHLGFDALFQFSPFYFVISFSVSVSVKLFGAGIFSIRIRGELEGTSPWHMEGEGSLTILFWDVAIPFSVTWGDSADTILPEIAALPVLRAEFEKIENWVALPPPASQLSVSLRTIDATEELVLHPVGALSISQRAVPLDLSIQKIGNKKVSDISRARIKIDASGLVATKPLKESFATAQFRDVEPAEKLSAPGFEKQKAGTEVSVEGSDTRTSHSVKRVVRQEVITIDTSYRTRVTLFVVVAIQWFVTMIAGNSTARSERSRSRDKERVPFDDKIRATEPGFIIANLADNSPWAGAAAFASHAQAQDMLSDQLKINPALAGELHVLPAAETQ